MTNETKKLLVYVAGPSAPQERPRARAFMEAVAQVPGCAVAHNWCEAMDRHGKGDEHLDEETLRQEALADLHGVSIADVVMVLTRPAATDRLPATSGGVLFELGVAMCGQHRHVVQVGETWPHPLFGALIKHRFSRDAEALAWLRGYALGRER